MRLSQVVVPDRPSRLYVGRCGVYTTGSKHKDSENSAERDEQLREGLTVLARIIARNLQADAENEEVAIGETRLPVANLKEAA